MKNLLYLSPFAEADGTRDSLSHQSLFPPAFVGFFFSCKLSNWKITYENQTNFPLKALDFSKSLQ